MLDYIKSLNFSEELKRNELYDLFETDSTELNKNFLSTLQNFSTTKEFLSYYTKQDFKKASDTFNNLFYISSNIYEKNMNTFFSEKDKYLSDVSKVIFLFSMIQKNNELLSYLLTSTKNLIKEICEENHNQKVQKKINVCLNDLINNPQLTPERNYSRRSTKENTISPRKIFTTRTFNKTSSDCFLFQCDTPKFEEEEEKSEIPEVNEEQQSNCNILRLKPGEFNTERKAYESHKDSKKTIGSTLSLKHMNFVYDTDEQQAIRGVKKNKSLKIGIVFHNPKYFFKTKSISNKINDNSSECDFEIEHDFNQKSSDKNIILTKFLNCINSLYKGGNITEEQKIKIKKIIISDFKKMIEKFIKYIISKSYFNNKIKNKYIKRFLLDEIKLL